jgi:hypothetical protein
MVARARFSKAASVFLALYGVFAIAYGVFSLAAVSFLTLPVGAHRVRGAVIGVLVGLLGVALLYRFRWAGILLAVGGCVIGVFVLRSLTPDVPSAVTVGYAVFAFLPPLLVCAAWPTLR